MEKQLPVDEAGVNLWVSGRGEQSRWKSYSFCLNRATHPTHIAAAPALTREFDTSTNLLLITSVAGQNVVQPPRGELLNPDVIFSEPAPISVTVRGTNIPEGSLARLRVTTSGGRAHSLRHSTHQRPGHVRADRSSRPRHSPSLRRFHADHSMRVEPNHE
jgi:hypothetical protein